jgi:hypothetical protein
MALTWGFGPAAHAEGVEAWTSYEVRVPIDDTASIWPHWLRIANDFRYGTGYPGIGQALLRVGPIWEPHGAFTLATHLTSSVEQRKPGIFAQEIRAELEPSVRWRWGDVHVNDRVRIERRAFPDEVRWRLRNRLQFSYQPAGWNWVPFASEEAFWEGGVYNQNRFSVGVSKPSGPHGRISLGYLLRTKGSAGAAWDQTHALTFSFLFSPVIDPLFDDGPSR